MTSPWGPAVLPDRLYSDEENRRVKEHLANQSYANSYEGYMARVNHSIRTGYQVSGSAGPLGSSGNVAVATYNDVLQDRTEDARKSQDKQKVRKFLADEANAEYEKYKDASPEEKKAAQDRLYNQRMYMQTGFDADYASGKYDATLTAIKAKENNNGIGGNTGIAAGGGIPGPGGGGRLTGNGGGMGISGNTTIGGYSQGGIGNGTPGGGVFVASGGNITGGGPVPFGAMAGALNAQAQARYNANRIVALNDPGNPLAAAGNFGAGVGFRGTGGMVTPDTSPMARIVSNNGMGNMAFNNTGVAPGMFGGQVQYVGQGQGNGQGTGRT